MIEISGEYGGSMSDDVLWPMQRRLNELFEFRMRRDYGTSVVLLAIGLRVSGAIQDFGSQAPGRLVHRQKDKSLEIDLTIPRSAWEDKPLDEVRTYLGDGLRATFSVLKERLAKIDKEADIVAWELDFETCLRQFLDEAGSQEERERELKYPAVKALEAYLKREGRDRPTAPTESPKKRRARKRIPRTIPIAWEKDYHTDQIGKYGEGHQFMGFVTCTGPSTVDQEFFAQKRWYAVLHIFDRSGKHLNSEVWFAGSAGEGERDVISKAEARLKEMVAKLKKVKYGNIRVGAFQVEVDGQTFGLVDTSDLEAGEVSVTLVPNDLLFAPPWDGTYST